MTLDLPLSEQIEGDGDALRAGDFGGSKRLDGVGDGGHLVEPVGDRVSWDFGGVGVLGLTIFSSNRVGVGDRDEEPASTVRGGEVVRLLIEPAFKTSAAHGLPASVRLSSGGLDVGMGEFGRSGMLSTRFGDRQ